MTGSTSSFTYDESTGKIITTYALTTDTTPMQRELSLRITGLLDCPPQALSQHQWRNLASGTPTAMTYMSPRGVMKVWDGKVFVTELDHHGVFPFVPDIIGTNAITGAPVGDCRHDLLRRLHQGDDADLRGLQPDAVERVVNFKDENGVPLAPVLGGEGRRWTNH